MSNIIVITTNSEYSRVTSYKGEIGIGTPYELSTDNGYEIIVTSDSVNSKLSALRSLQTGYKNASISNLRKNYGGGDGDNAEDKMIDWFKAKLRDILYTAGVPADAVGSQVKQFFPYPRNFSRIDAARDYIVAVLEEWIGLFQHIVENKSGLVRVPEPAPPPPLPPEPVPYFRLVEVASSTTRENYGAITVDIVKFQIPIFQAILSASSDILKLKTLQFFDESREYKTIFNLGVDNQYVAEAWRPVYSNSASLQLKLTKPLDGTVNIYDSAYISRDLANTVVDTLTISTLPEVDTTPYLRPANTKVGNYVQSKQALNNATLTSLGTYTGSVGVISGTTISYDDKVFNRWYTSDFNSSELNIDFSDYSNFVHFGSAENRLQAFREKLRKIEQLNTQAAYSSSNIGERQRVVEQEFIKRNFDPYEQYLYFTTQSTAYSASAYYADNGVEYNATGSWPKQTNGTPYPTTSSIAQNWFVTQSTIANQFDQFNPNLLVRQLPNYLQEDEESGEFLTFINLFGHMLDNVKVYIDQYPNIYSTSTDPFEDLTMDQVYEVAQSFGLKLPNAYSLESLQGFIASVYDGEGTRSLVAETWKRFLHSLIYLSKTKGSRTALDGLLNIYGLSSPLIQIKEASYPSRENYIQSEELVYALQTHTGSAHQYINLDVTGQSVKTIQLRFGPTFRTASTILGDKNWSWDIRLATHPSASVSQRPLLSGSGVVIFDNSKVDYGRLEVYSTTGATKVLNTASGYFPLFGDDYVHVMLRSSSNNFDLQIIQTDGTQILYRETSSGFFSASAFDAKFRATTNLVFGAPTDASTSVVKYTGILDDIRVWNEYIETDTFVKQAYDPGSNFGNTYTSSYDGLLYDIGFNIYTSSISQSVVNESAYYGQTTLTTGSTVGFTTESYVRVLRNIKQYTPLVGSTAYSNTKVHVASDPVFKDSFVDENGTYQLSSKVSILPLSEKQYTQGQPTVYFAISPTDYVNANILRSMGVVDVNYLIGSPRKMVGERYKEVDELLEYYLENYNKEISPNEYIRFFSNVLKGPTEYAEQLIPGRTKLIDGIVIESPVLERRRVQIQKDFKISGTNTENFFDFQSSSYTASVAYDAGAYSFDASYDMIDETDYSVITNPVIQILGPANVSSSYVTSSLMSSNNAYLTIESTIVNDTDFINSTVPAELPIAKQFLQEINNSWVSSSFVDQNSSFLYIEAFLSQSVPVQTSSGYPRNPYYGLVNRIPGEDNTVIPYLDIRPVSDFDDVGTTNYFHRSTGIYKFPSRISRYEKETYLAKFDTAGEVSSPISQLFGKITLLPSSSLVDLPGRTSTEIKSREYASGSYHSGILRISKLFTLLAIEGASGLRVRLYRDEGSQIADVDRPYVTLPTQGSGVLFDGLLGSDEEVFPYLMVQSEDGIIYFTVSNVTSNSIVSTVKMYYFEYEPPVQIPQGYLPRHYKFYRNTSAGYRRRNYLGCKSVFCPEGCPPDVTPTDPSSPVQVTVSTTTDVVVYTDPLPVLFPAEGVTRTTQGGLPTSEPVRTPSQTSGTGQPSPIDQTITFGGKGKLNDKKK